MGDSVTQGYYDLYDDIVPLKNQLKKLVEATDYHVKCGIVGIRRLLHALSKCELSEYALKLLKKDGYPGYKLWMDNDATTLWEKWDINTNSDSKNHHMYSDFMSWLIKTLGGIRLNEEKCGELEFDFAPHFIKGIDFVNLSYQTVKGNITVNWKKNGNTVNITLKKDAGVKIKYNDKYIENEFNEWNIRV